MGVLLDPSISWGATACSGGHSACVVFRQLGVPVLETDEDHVWCFGCSFDGANLGIRRAKMEGMPMADTRDAAPQGSAKFASFVVTALTPMADLQVDPMVALGNEIALQWSSTNSTEKCPPSPAPPSD